MVIVLPILHQGILCQKLPSLWQQDSTQWTKTENGTLAIFGGESWAVTSERASSKWRENPWVDKTSVYLHANRT